MLPYLPELAYHFHILPWHIEGAPRLSYREIALFRLAIDKQREE